MAEWWDQPIVSRSRGDVGHVRAKTRYWDRKPGWVEADIRLAQSGLTLREFMVKYCRHKDRGGACQGWSRWAWSWHDWYVRAVPSSRCSRGKCGLDTAETAVDRWLASVAST